MLYTEIISCRLAIQVCIGHFQNGRQRHRTFSMKRIRPDASNEAIAAIIRALAPVLAYPITKVRKVTKRTIFFDNNTAPAAPAVVLPVPVEPEAVPVMPAPVPEPADPKNPVWKAGEKAKFAFALLVMYLLWVWILSRLSGGGGARIGFRTGRSPP